MNLSFKFSREDELATIVGVVKQHVEDNIVYHPNVYIFILNLTISYNFYHFSEFF